MQTESSYPRMMFLYPIPIAFAINVIGAMVYSALPLNIDIVSSIWSEYKPAVVRDIIAYDAYKVFYMASFTFSLTLAPLGFLISVAMPHSTPKPPKSDQSWRNPGLRKLRIRFFISLGLFAGLLAGLAAAPWLIPQNPITEASSLSNPVMFYFYNILPIYLFCFFLTSIRH